MSADQTFAESEASPGEVAAIDRHSPQTQGPALKESGFAQPVEVSPTPSKARLCALRLSASPKQQPSFCEFDPSFSWRYTHTVITVLDMFAQPFGTFSQGLQVTVIPQNGLPHPEIRQTDKEPSEEKICETSRISLRKYPGKGVKCEEGLCFPPNNSLKSNFISL